MALSYQAFVLIVIYVIAILILSSAMYNAPSGGFGSAIQSFVVVSIAAIIATFEVNCLTKGNCNKYSWLKTFFYALAPVALIALTAYAYSNNKNSTLSSSGTSVNTGGNINSATNTNVARTVNI